MRRRRRSHFEVCLLAYRESKLGRFRNNSALACRLELPSFNQFKSRCSRTIISLIATALLLGVACAKRQEQKLQSPPPAVEAGRQVLIGRVVAVADGDTVTVLDSSDTQHRIRLEGIDAPESHQAFGSRSKQNLSDLVFGKDITVTYYKTDQYGRLVGKILLEGKDVNLEQVKAGMAWHYKEYQREQTPTDRELYDKADDEARATRRGLWIDPDPVEPSQFRREEREERRARRSN